MDPVTTRPKVFLNQLSCLQVPRYQRRYEWEIKHAHQLIRDVAEAVTKPENESPHWIGVILWNHAIPKRRCPKFDTDHTCREVIDGQQRLTTLFLWATAIVDHAKSSGEELKNFMSTFRLQEKNASELQQILDGEDVSKSKEPLHLIYTYFRYLLWLGEDAITAAEPFKMASNNIKGKTQEERWQRNVDKSATRAEPIKRSPAPPLHALLTATAEKLSFVAIEIQLTDGDASAVFDALNGNRMSLRQFDHLRNFCFREIDDSIVDSLYEESWSPSETVLDKMKSASIKKPSDHFFYNYMISIGEGSIGKFNQNQTFTAFRRYYRSKRMGVPLEQWVKDGLPKAVTRWKYSLQPIGSFYVGNRKIDISTATSRALSRIRIASEGPPIPLVMMLLHRTSLPKKDPKYFSTSELEKCAITLEGVLYKTLMNGDSLTNFRALIIKSMLSWEKSCVTDSSSLGSEKLRLKLLNLGPKWSPDLKSRLDNSWNSKMNSPSSPDGIYKDLPSKALLALLDALEEEASGPTSVDLIDRNGGAKEHPYEIDHIYPQKGKKWKSDLNGWNQDETTMQKQLHRIGNLAPVLSEINKKMSNKNLEDKKTIMAKSQMPALFLNQWENEKRWTKNEIGSRTGVMLDMLINRWPDK
jgi:hypothetical protein